ncbi:unnamed protein product [Microthlaspi erraticum]|uniref:Uncharacterized protein n=1 Tax=Microthlaspi erraticum TaxID=1685480 RepID=A0A6D2J863_9BRAS|nr:unnamed protein product [Microthlaspi erraticum]CAA7033239.1 unnamed protein product [Microthlaspi erraticum]CAA7033270.1 unnamed protein product [Microthlaspi erraticum]CAA7057412.1 unnamed protein product [Microthlaspi erraticum]
MYYSDLVAVAEKDMTSRNFLCLVDAAVMLYEEAKEESDERIFHRFPRKPRSSVEKFVTSRRNPQQNYQNLNGASTSSLSPSLLGDYKITAEPEKTAMMIYPRNPLQWHSSSSSSSLLLDLNTIPADDSEKRPTKP